MIVFENLSLSFRFVKAIVIFTGLRQSAHCKLLLMSIKYYDIQQVFCLLNAGRVRGLLLCSSNKFISFLWTSLVFMNCGSAK